MYKRLLFFILVRLLFLVCEWCGKPVIEIIMPHAKAYSYEAIRYWAFGNRVLEPAGFGFGAGEKSTVFCDSAGVTSETVYDALKQFNVVMLPVPFEGLFKVNAGALEGAESVSHGLKRYLEEGGSLLSGKHRQRCRYLGRERICL